MFRGLRDKEVKNLRELAQAIEELAMKFKSLDMVNEQAAELLKANAYRDLASDDSRTDYGRCSKVEAAIDAVELDMRFITSDEINDKQKYIKNATDLLLDALKLLGECNGGKAKLDFNRLVAATHAKFGYLYKATHQYAEADKHFSLAATEIEKIPANDRTPKDKENIEEYQLRHQKAARSEFKSKNGALKTFMHFGRKGYPGKATEVATPEVKSPAPK